MHRLPRITWKMPRRFQKPTLIAVALILIGSVGFGALRVHANSCTSNGTGGGNWNTSATWTSCGSTTPQSGDSVTIAAGDTVTLNTSPTIVNLTFAAGSSAAVLSDDGSHRTLTITGAVTMGQPTSAATNAWNINGGTATVSGLITYSGSTNAATKIAKIALTGNGVLNANGGITFTASNNASAVLDTTGGGTINMKGALTMPANSGTLNMGSPTSYGYKRSITVDHTKVPNTDQTDFPVLVSLTDATLKVTGSGGNVDSASGYDINFFSDSGLTTKLNWEMERYVSTTGEVIAWVKIPTLSHTSDTVFYMAYGNAAITTDHSTPSGVWDSHFKGVYHLADGTSLSTTDATGVNNATNNSGSAHAGEIDGGVVLDGSGSQYINTPVTGNGFSTITISGWVYFTGNTGAQPMFVGNMSGGSGYGITISQGAGSLLQANFGVAGCCGVFATSGGNVGTGSWRFITGTYDGSHVQVYLDGVAGTQASQTGTLSSGSGIRIGDNGGGSWGVSGYADEVRISDNARSADWITTEYNNESSPGTFNTLGSETPLSAGNSSSFNYNDSSAQTITMPSAGNYNNLLINNAGGATLGAAVTTGNVTGDISVQSGTFKNGGFDITGGTAGAFSVSNGATFEMSGTSTYPTGFTGITFGASSTVRYLQTTSPLAITSATYGNLELKPAGTATQNFPSGSMTVAGNLTVGDGTHTTTGSANANSTTLTVNGDFTIAASATFVAHASNMLTIGGSYSNSGTFTNSSGSVTFNSTSSGKTLAGSMTGGSAFYNLTFNGVGGVWTFSSGSSVANNLAITNGTVDDGSHQIAGNATGTFTTGAGGTLKLGGTGAGGGGGSAIVQHKSEYTGGDSITPDSDVGTGNLLIAMMSGQTGAGSEGGYTISDTGGNTWTMLHSEYTRGGADQVVFLAYAYNSVPGPTTISFSSAASDAAVQFIEVSGVQNTSDPLDTTVSTDGLNSYVTDAISSTLTTTTTDFILDYYIEDFNAETINEGTGYTLIDKQEGHTDAEEYLSSAAAGTYNPDFNLGMSDNAWQSFALGFKETGGGGAGSPFPSGFTGPHTTLNAASTIIYNGTSDQVISHTPTYGNLRLSAASGTPTKTLDGDTTAAGTVTIDSSNTLDTGTNYALTIGGSYSNSGTFTGHSSTVTFNATSSGKTLAGSMTSGSAFYNLVFDGVSGAWTFSNAVAVGNDFTVTNGDVTAGSNALTVTRDYTLANTSGVAYHGGSSTITVSRHFTDSGGKFAYGTSTVALTGTGTATGSLAFYNLSVGYSGFTTTMASGANVYDILTFNGGTVTTPSVGYLDVITHCDYTSTPVVFASATTLSGSLMTLDYSSWACSETITAGNYGTWNIHSSFDHGTGMTKDMGGDITTSGDFSLTGNNGDNTSVFNTQNHNLTAGAFFFGNWNDGVTANFGSSTVTITSIGIGFNQCTTCSINLGSSSVSVTGDIALSDGTSSISLTPGTSTVTMKPAAAATTTLTPNGQSFYNFVVDGVGGTVQAGGAVVATHDFTITHGTYDVSGSNYGLTVGGSYTNNGTFKAQSGTVTFNATGTGKTLSGSLGGNSAFYNLTFNGSGGGWTLGSTSTVRNNLAITNGTVDDGGYQIAGNVSGTLTTGAGGTLKLGGSGSGGSGSSVVQSKALYDGSTSALAYNSAPTAGNLLITTIEYAFPNGTPTVSDSNGNTWTVMPLVTASATVEPAIMLAYAYNCKGGATTVTWAMPGGRRGGAGNVEEDYGLQIMEVSGIQTGSDPADIIKANTSRTTTTTPATGTMVTSAPDFIYNVYSDESEYTTQTAGTGYTISDQDNTHIHAAEYKTGVAPGSYSPGFTTSGTVTDWVMEAVAFKEAPNTATSLPLNYTTGHTTLDAASTIIYKGTGNQTISSIPSAYGNLQLSAASGTPTKTLDGAITAAGGVTVDSSNTLDVSGSNYVMTIGGSFANNGTFTAHSGTVTLNGSSQQTVSGTFTSGSAFYNLTVTNATGTDASDGERTSFVPSIIFSGSATSTNNFVATTAHTRIEYHTGSTYTFNNINWNGQASGTKLYFRNSATSGTWLLKVTGTQTAVSYVNVSRSDASVSGGSTIAANDGTNFGAGNNTNWNLGGITVSGNIYVQGSESTTNSTSVSVSLSIDNAAPTTATSQTTSYSFSNVTSGAGTVIAVYIDGNSLDANTFTVSGGSDITSLNLYISRTAIYNHHSGSTTNANICAQSTYPASGDNLFTCSSTVPTYTGDSLLLFGAYAPGGNVNTPAIKIESGGTYAGGSETLNITSSGVPSSFSYKRTLTLDHTKVPASQTDFPVLVSLTDATLKVTGSGGHVQNSSGYDINFFSDSALTTKLSWEVEKYVSTTGEIEAWVKIPTLSSSSDTVIYMAYGNSGISTFQGGSTGAAWDSNYKMVLHLPDGSSLNTNDSTSNADNATNNGATATTGQIDGAAALNGSSQYLSQSGYSFDHTTPNITFEAWANLSSAGDYPMILSVGGSRPELRFSSNTLKPEFSINTSVVASSPVTTGTWHQIVGTFDGSTIKLYVDGASVGTQADTANQDRPVDIGERGGGAYFFPGSLDEVRISSSVRDANWIAAQYNNQSSPGTFETLGSEGTPSSLPPFDIASGTFTPTTNTVTFTGTGSISIPVTTFYNLQLYPASGTQTYTLGSGALTAHNLDLGNGSTLTVAANTNNPTVVVSGDMTNNSGSTWVNGSGALSIGGSYANSGTYTAGTGTITFTSGSSGKTLSGNLTGSSALYKAVFNGPSAFGYSRALAIDHTKVGSSDSTNFTALISLTDATLKVTGSGGHVQNSSGYDINFFSDAALTTKLNWEVEKYTSSTGEVIAWVKIPTLSHTTDTTIYMAYGNSSISTFQGGSTGSAWDSYTHARFHLDDNAANTTVADSSANANTGTANVDTNNFPTTGVIGNGFLGNGSTAFSFPFPYTSGNSFTFTTWVKIPNTSSLAWFLGRYSDAAQFYVDTTGQIDFLSMSGGGQVASAASVANNTWAYVSGKYDAGGNLVYINLNGVESSGGAGTAPSTWAGSMSALWNNFRPSQAVSMDEIRVDNTYRSAAWSLAEYNNQSAPSTFMSTGSEQVPGGSWTINDPLTVTNDATDTLNIALGTVTLGNGSGDNLEVRGGMLIGATANQTATFQTAAIAAGGTITVDINQNSSGTPPACTNCAITVGATSGSGTGSFKLAKNSILRLNPNSASQVDLPVTVNSTGYFEALGSQDYTGTSTAGTGEGIIADSGKSWTTGENTAKVVRLTSGLALGQMYTITGTTSHISSYASTESAAANMTVTGSGTTRLVCSNSTTLITADHTGAGRYIYDKTGSVGYLQIIDSKNNDATCSGSKDSFTVVANPDSLAVLANGDTFTLSDGVRSGDTYEILDLASVTAEAGTACTATTNETGKGEAYINALTGSQSLIQYADVCNLGRNSSGKYGLTASTINGGNSGEGLTITKTRLRNNYYGLRSTALVSDTLTNNLISGNAVNGLYLNGANTSTTVTGNLISSNGAEGAYLSSVTGTTLSSNTALANTTAGFALTGSTTNTLSSNTALGNSAYGIQLISGSNNNTLSSNTAQGNATAGIGLNASLSNSVATNTVASAGSGILLAASSANNSLTGNSATSSANGIDITGSINNIVGSNTLSNNTTSGLTLESSSHKTSVYGNTVSANPKAFILSSSNNTAFSGNTVSNNTRGIYNALASTGTTVTGGTYSGSSTADIDLNSTASTMSLFNTTLSSSTKVAGDSNSSAFIISRGQDGTAGKVGAWGQYTTPSSDTTETPQTESTDTYSYASALWAKSATAHGYSGTGTEDSNLDYDLSSASLGGGPYAYRAVAATNNLACGSTTFTIYRNGTNVGTATCGSLFTDSNGSVNVKFKIDGGASPSYALGDTYTFTVWDASSDSNTKKTVQIMTTSGSYTVPSGATLTATGTAANPTEFTRGFPAGGWHMDVAGIINAQYYTMNYLGNTNGGNGLNLQSGATVTNLANGTYDNYQSTGTLFSYKRSLVIDHTKVPNTDQTNFPVLVSFTDATLKVVGSSGHVQNSSGYDINFFSDAALTTKLNWEVEKYVSTTGEIEAWVKVPTLSHTADTTIYMAYGNPSISTFQGGSAGSVWDTNFKGVWHLADGTTLSTNDSTSNTSNLTNSGATAGTGLIDGAAALNGTSQTMTVPFSGGGFTGITVGGWYYFSGSSSSSVAGLIDSQNRLELNYNSSNSNASFLVDGNNVNQIAVYSSSISFNAWHYVVGTYDGSHVRIYVDGTVGGTAPALTGAITGGGGSLVVNHSAYSWNTSGFADEVRVSDAARSGDWITTEYNNQSNPGTFEALGSETATGGGPGSYITIHGSLIGSGSPAKTFAGLSFTQTSSSPLYTITEANGSPSNGNYWLFSTAACNGWSTCEGSDSDTGDGAGAPNADGFIRFVPSVNEAPTTDTQIKGGTVQIGGGTVQIK